MAAESAHGSSNRIILGRYEATGEYIQHALDGGGVFFDTSSEVYYRLRDAGIDPWEINKAFLRQQEEAGRTFEYVLRGLDDVEFASESEAIFSVFYGDMDGALTRLDIPDGRPIPARLLEAEWLEAQGYVPVVEKGAQVIRWIRP